MNASVEISKDALCDLLKGGYENDAEGLCEIVDKCTTQYDSVCDVIVRLYKMLPDDKKGWVVMELTSVND